VRDGDLIRIVIDRRKLEGSVDLVGTAEGRFEPEEGAHMLAGRPPRPDLAPDPDLPDDTRLWALLQAMGGGAWAGCVYDLAAIAATFAGTRPSER
jgi:dihydroxyacid dehydratase/phosphogluconate dehydratase